MIWGYGLSKKKGRNVLVGVKIETILRKSNAIEGFFIKDH